MVSSSRTPSDTVSQISKAVKIMSNISNSDGDDHRESLSDTISLSHWKDHKNHRCALFQGKTSKILARFTAEIKTYFKVKQRIHDKCPRKREQRRYESAPLSGGAVLALLVWPENFQLYCHCLDSCKSITLALKDTRHPSTRLGSVLPPEDATRTLLSHRSGKKGFQVERDLLIVDLGRRCLKPF